uniref:Uncharacterized protein n=1 Tax=Panthera tigris altaica TaxID=74533 RepID=A0A8C9MAA7_PANTA
GQDTLLHGEALFVIVTTDSDHVTLPFFTQSIHSDFCSHMLLTKSFWQPVAGKEMFSFILKLPTASKVVIRKSIGEGQKERETQSPKQAPGSDCQHRA